MTSKKCKTGTDRVKNYPKNKSEIYINLRDEPVFSTRDLKNLSVFL